MRRLRHVGDGDDDDDHEYGANENDDDGDDDGVDDDVVSDDDATSGLYIIVVVRGATASHRALGERARFGAGPRRGSGETPPNPQLLYQGAED